MAILSDRALAKRVISALILIPVVLVEIYLGHPWFDVLVILFGIVMAWEWARMVGRRRNPEDAAPQARLPASGLAWPGLASMAIIGIGLSLDRFPELGFLAAPGWAVVVGGAALALACAWPSQGLRAFWFGLGILYVAIPCLAILWIRDDPTYGLANLIWLLSLVVAADSCAYLFGRSLGGPKLAPRLSPSKTWSGLIGAILGAGAVGLATALSLPEANIWFLSIFSAALAIVEQIGDLLESGFKRRFGIKDTSRIIPGHGGVLDRVDGLAAVSATVALLNFLLGRSLLVWP